MHICFVRLIKVHAHSKCHCRKHRWSSLYNLEQDIKLTFYEKEKYLQWAYFEIEADMLS